MLPNDTETRKLAAIVFTDIKGFSKKMAENETVAFDLLKTHDALLRVLTAKFDGRVIKSLGDSFMIDFPSAVNAVKCAIEAQKRFWHFNKGKSESQMIEIRVGIHMGDVIIRSEDIIGDGVNIASRIEAMTEANRIWISQDVYQQVRNKIPLQVFPLGPQRLKNIPEPVEVYEILIENIPEFAKPSAAAMEAKTNNQEEQTLQREADEAREARRVEEAKLRAIKDTEKSEEERKKKVAEHYAKAQKYFDEGKLEEAEKELNEVYELDPQQRINAERRLAEQEKEKAVQAHLAKGRELLAQGRLDDAENEVNEIFREFPLHVGAQGLLLEIEEGRYRQEEQQRSKRAEESPKAESDEDRRINELLDRARLQMQEERFSEATFTLHELFRIDPNHSGGRRLEENLRQAKQAKAELARINAEQAEEEKRQQQLANLRRRLEEQRQRQARAPKRVGHTMQYKRIATYAIIAVAAVVSLFVVPKIIDWIFPKSASIAVLRFSEGTRQAGSLDLSEALPLLLSEDFMRCQHLSTIAPSTSLLMPIELSQLQKVASSLPAEYILTGTVQEDEGRYAVALRLFNAGQNQMINIGKFEGSFPMLGQMRKTIVRTALNAMDIKSSVPEINQPSDSHAFAKYIEAVHLLRRGTGTDIAAAKDILSEAVSIDPSFSLAYRVLADAELRLFQVSENPQNLKSAMDYARQALGISADNVLAYRALGTGYRFMRQYDAALASIATCLEFLPKNPGCYRELALLALIAGKYDDASKYASNALASDPQNPESCFALGLVHQMKKDYLGAANFYQKAQALEPGDSLLAVRYLANAWIGAGQQEKAIQYLKSALEKSPKDYRYFYWIGRAYQLAVNVDLAQQWLEEGFALAQQSIDANRNDVSAYAYAGLFESRLGKFAEGEKYLNSALLLDSTSADIFFRCADLYSVQRNKQKALSALRKGLQKMYKFYEIIDPDLFPIAGEPEFQATISANISGTWPAK
jgi:class 3 adenylate cyclase/Tfp pilus assembly protein PilF/TolB-like protein